MNNEGPKTQSGIPIKDILLDPHSCPEWGTADNMYADLVSRPEQVPEPVPKDTGESLFIKITVTVVAIILLGIIFSGCACPPKTVLEITPMRGPQIGMADSIAHQVLP